MLAVITQYPKTAKFLEADAARKNVSAARACPRKLPNKEVRAREYLTAHEVEALRKAARGVGRQGHRDDTLVLLMFRHALRVSEVVSLRWEQVDLSLGLLHVRRVKNGIPSTHPLRGLELRALRQLKREHTNSPYVFVSERSAPLTARTIRHIVARAGDRAKIG